MQWDGMTVGVQPLDLLYERTLSKSGMSSKRTLMLNQKTMGAFSIDYDFFHDAFRQYYSTISQAERGIQTTSPITCK